MFTILKKPIDFVPAYNEQLFVVNSDNNTEPRYRYIAKVILSTGADVITLKSFPHPADGYGYFDVSRIVEQLVTHDIDKRDVSGFQRNAKSISHYAVDFYEEYEVSGNITLSALQAVSGYIRIHNASLSEYDKIKWYNNKLTIDNGVFLSHKLDRYVRMGDSGWIYWLNDDVNIIQRMTIRATTPNFGVLATVENIYNSNGMLFTDRAMRADCAPFGLNNIWASFISDGAQPIIPDNTLYYTITFEGIKNGDPWESEPFNFIVQDECYKPAVNVLHGDFNQDFNADYFNQ